MKYLNKYSLFLFILIITASLPSCNWPDVVDDNPEITLYILPSPAEGGTFEELNIRAVTEGDIPEDAKYVWDFGDGSEKVTVLNNNTVTYTYLWAGTYIIKIELFDNVTEELIDKTTAEAKITLNLYNLVRNYPYLTISFKYKAKTTFEHTVTNTVDEEIIEMHQLIENLPLRGGTGDDCPLIWDGPEFIVNIGYTGKDELGNDVVRTGKITGKLSEDGTSILELDANNTDIFTSYIEQTDTYITTDFYKHIRLVNVPFSIVNILPPYEVYYGQTGVQVDKLVQSYTWYGGDVDRQNGFREVNEVLYDDKDYPPELYIVFSGLEL